MNINEIVGRLKAGGLDASSTNRSAAVYVTEARSGRAEPGWFGFRIVCDSEATERRVRAVLSRWYDIDANGNVWRLKSKNRVPLMAIKRGGVPPTPPTPTSDYLYFEAAQANSTVSMMSTMSMAPDLEYSTDGETWQEWQHTTAEGTHTFDTLTLTNIGDRVYLRGDNPNGLCEVPEGVQQPNFSNFTLTGSINGGGNIMSLLDTSMVLTEVPQYGFVLLFSFLGEGQGSSVLLTPPAMDTITAIGDFGCYSMYGECTSLTAAADMPSLNVIGENALKQAYSGCSSLTAAADMPIVSSFGESSIASMYEGMSDITVLCEADMQTQTVTSLKFEFPELPVNVGTKTLDTLLGVVMYIVYGV